MKAAVTDGRGKVWIQTDIPVPQPDAYQCLVKIAACAGCTGTDVKHIHDKLPWQQTYPGLLGHESIGQVIEVGARVTAYAEGDWVLRPTPVFPGDALAGYSSMWGGFSEYGLVTDAAALVADHPDITPNNFTRFQLTVPELPGVTPADWTMIITLKEVAGYAASCGVRLNLPTVVLGAGSVGTAMMRLAKILGATPLIAVARRDEQLESVRTVTGFDAAVNATTTDVIAAVRKLTGGKGAELIIDTTGSLEFMEACVPALSETGKIAGYATYARGDSAANHVPAGKLTAGRTGEDTTHDYMLAAVRMGLVNLRDFYDCTMPLADIAEGFELLQAKKAAKIVFVMD